MPAMETNEVRVNEGKKGMGAHDRADGLEGTARVGKDGEGGRGTMEKNNMERKEYGRDFSRVIGRPEWEKNGIRDVGKNNRRRDGGGGFGAVSVDKRRRAMSDRMV